jgi:AraC-like DNA-binding protein
MRHSPEVPRAGGDWARARRGGRGVELLEAEFEHHIYDRHSHDTLAIGITLRGVQRFWCRGSTHDSRPGDVIVLDPGEVHDGRSGAHGGYAYRMLYIDADVVREIVADASGRRSPDSVSDAPLVHDPILAAAIDTAWMASAESPHSLEASERLEAIVQRWAMEVRRNELRPAVKLHAIRQVRDYLHDRIDEPVTTIDLARVAGLSRFQLTRQFQRALGLPLHAYHLQIRLEEARRRLQQGQTIAAVAADLGFVDQSHLHRRFRARFGVTPAQWRRTAIQDR